MAHENEAVEEAMKIVREGDALDTPRTYEDAAKTLADEVESLAEEVTRLRASAPKVWDAGSMEGMPEGMYFLREMGLHETSRVWNYQAVKRSRARWCIRRIDGCELAFGPIPQPPAGGA